MSTPTDTTALKVKYALGGVAIGIALSTAAVYAHFFSLNEAQMSTQTQLKSDMEVLDTQNKTLQLELEAKSKSAHTANTSVDELKTQLEESQAQTAQQAEQLKALKQQYKQVQQLQAQQAKKLTSNQAELVALQQKSTQQKQVLEQSKQFFQSQLTLQHKQVELNKERAKLIPILNKLVQQCQLFNEGKSWDAKSDACDRKQKASDKLKRIDEQIDANQKKVVAIDSTTDMLGL